MRHQTERSENVRGYVNDVIKVARQSLNRSNASRVISKQECMVELTNLPLTICSEQIENINISGAMKISWGKNSKEYTSSLLQKYQQRSSDFEEYSFCEYIHHDFKSKRCAKTVIPHFIGMTSSPTYPPTVSYSRATLIIYIPWRQAKFHNLSDSECLNEFHKNMKNNVFPISVVLAYNKVKQQSSENRCSLEPVQTSETYESRDEEISQEEKDLIRAMTSIAANLSQTITLNGNEYNRGLDYDWSKRIYPVRFYNTTCNKKIKRFMNWIT